MLNTVQITRLGDTDTTHTVLTRTFCNDQNIPLTCPIQRLRFCGT